MSRIIYLQHEKSRVKLGFLERSDLDFLRINMNNPEVTQWLGSTLPKNDTEQIAFIDSAQDFSGKSNKFAVINVETSQIMGVMALHSIDHVNKNATSGSWLAPEFQGTGFGFHAKMLLLYHAFYHLGLNKVSSTALAQNSKSIGHNQKAGYQVIGIQKQHKLFHGELCDMAMLECMKTDWKPLWEKFIL